MEVTSAERSISWRFASFEFKASRECGAEAPRLTGRGRGALTVATATELGQR